MTIAEPNHEPNSRHSTQRFEEHVVFAESGGEEDYGQAGR